MFLVPMGEAIVTTVIQKVVGSNEKKAGAVKKESSVYPGAASWAG
jgi:hypothetical protein